MKRNCCATGAAAEYGTTAFQILFGIQTAYLISSWATSIVVGQFQEVPDDDDYAKDEGWQGRWGTYPDDPDWLIGVRAYRNIIDLLLWIFMLIVTMRLRRYVRNKYSIPTECCCCKGDTPTNNCCEDFCCALFCTPCTICQMARHTADYQKYGAGCCTQDGLSASAPEVV